MSRGSRKFCFTLNNYNDADILLFTQHSDIKYCMFGYEVGEHGTPHLQGWFWLKTQKRFGYIKTNIHPTMHVEVMKGTISHNIDYCSKSSVLPVVYYPDKDTIMDLYVAKNKSLPELVVLRMSGDIEVLAGDAQYILHKRCIDETAHELSKYRLRMNSKHEMSLMVLRPWQDLLYILLQKQSSRHVYWLSELVGDVGKSMFGVWLAIVHGWLLLDVKTNITDIGYLLAQHTYPGVVIDIPRSSVDNNGYPIVSYQTIECIKNRFITTTKYLGYSGPITTGTVLVMSNYDPNKERLSADRWVHFTCTKEYLF
jgi:hypothetical protein